MAGAGRKTFVAGAVLTASDVNSYLMDQSVMRFASASARSTAIPTPSEGMMSYLDDTNQVEVYTGASWGQVSASVTPVPHAMSAINASFGSLNLQSMYDIGVSGAGVTVTFPSGRFSVAPIVTIAPGFSSADSWPGIRVSSVAASAVSFFVVNAGPRSGSPGFGQNLTSFNMSVIAVQYSTGSASG
jgi:hypothetical protein